MIKVTDLMIGDYVTFADCIENSQLIPIKIVALGFQDGDGENSSLVSIDNDNACDMIDIDEEIVGIPLTPEILEKNGFGYSEKDDVFGFTHYYLGSECFCENMNIHIGKNKERYCLNTPLDDIHGLMFVHELQHAFKLLKINKEITL